MKAGMLALVVACGTTPVVVPAPTPSPAPDPAPAPTTFAWKVGPVSAEGLVSWRPGCPTPIEDLRAVELSHWDFDGQLRHGTLVVHRDAVPAMRAAFEAAFDDRFPIRSIRPIDEFGGSDDRSMAADNTSAFNCRPIKGTSTWSEHATGKAVDINPRENPWVQGDKVDPPDGNVVRDPSIRGVLGPDSAMVRAFRDQGWGWGGTWSSRKDWQHFSESGR